jgi:sortase B
MKSLFSKKDKKNRPETDSKKQKQEEEQQESAVVPFKQRFTEKKVVRFLDKLTDRILILMCIILLFLGGYALLDTIHIYYHANDTSLLKYKPKVDAGGVVRDPLSLPGAVGWLTLDGTQVDYPIMQGSDNNAYLNKDPYGNYSLSGSLFLDASNSPDFTDQYSMIYGHHMEHNSMFGALDEYLKPEYFEKHRSGSIIIGNKSYKLVLFAALECSAYQKEIFDVKNGGALNYIRANASILYADDVTDYDQILAMSTCQEADSDQRTVIFAVIVGGPGTLNSDGSQKSTTSGDDVGTGEKERGTPYLYWFGLFVAIAVGAATVAMMRNDKNKQKLVMDENAVILDASYTPVKETVEKTTEQPMAPPVPEPIVQPQERTAEPIVEEPEIKLIEMNSSAIEEVTEAAAPAKKKPARRSSKKTTDSAAVKTKKASSAKTSEKPKRKTTAKKTVKPEITETAPVEKIEAAPVAEKPKRKTATRKKTVKPAVTEAAPVEKIETAPVIEKPKRKPTVKKETVKSAVETPVKEAETKAEKPKRKTPAKRKAVKAEAEPVDQPKEKRTRKASTASDAKKEAVKKMEKKPAVKKKKASATTEKKPAKTTKKKVKPAGNTEEQS